MFRHLLKRQGRPRSYGEVCMKKNSINKYAILITRGILVGGVIGGLFALVSTYDVLSGVIGGAGTGAVLLTWVGLGGNIAELRNKRN
tara:strand:+ start:605 stop:865 length:261 start_codon:yes stop_codon:yes gene_type:complete